MRRTPRSLADAREELVQIEQEFIRLQKRIEVVRDCVTDSLVRFFLRRTSGLHRLDGRGTHLTNCWQGSRPTEQRPEVSSTGR